MIQYIIECITGLLAGLILGITGIPAIGLMLLILDYFKITDYKTILGTVMFLNLFPISGISFFEFYKAKQIDFVMGFILLISIIIGSSFGSKLVISEDYKLSTKTIKYITSGFGALISIAFYFSAQYEKN
jgi:uncharacterized membrane protein YfcA